MHGVFVGRQAEGETLRNELAQARTGVPRVMLVTGPAGIGKTALIRRFLEAGAEGAQVLRGDGDEEETGISFGVIQQLVTGLPVPLVARLTGVVSGEIPPPAPLAVGAELVAVLGELQDDKPVVVVVDDAQWADRPSLAALTFALRRLHADQVLALVVGRPGMEAALPAGLVRLADDDSGGRLSLRGLATSELAALAVAAGIGHLPERMARRLHDYTEGNPLYALTVLRELGVEALRPDAPPAAPPSVSALMLAGLARCSEPAQRLVRAAAVMGRRCPLAVAACVARIGQPLEALQEGVAAGLVRLDDAGAAIVFGHPMIHAAVYRDLGPAERAQLHTRAAQLLSGDDALEHRVRAAVPGDRVLAAELCVHADSQAARGFWSAAARCRLGAARLHPDIKERSECLVRAAMLMLASSDVAGVMALKDDIAALPPSAGRDYVLGHLTLCSGDVLGATALLEEAFAACDIHTDAEVAAAIAAFLCECRVVSGRGHDSAEMGRTALRLAHPSSPTRGAAWGSLLVAMATTGRGGDALELAARAEPQSSMERLGLLFGTGVVRLWTDDVDGARRDLSSVEAQLAGAGPVTWTTPTLYHLADAELRAGAWADALAHAHHIESIVTDTDDLLAAPFHDALLGTVHALRGDWAIAEALVARAGSVAGRRGDLSSVATAAIAAAHLACARGDPAGVVDAAAPLVAARDRDGVREPGVSLWHDLHAEALVRLGRLDEAEEALVALEALAAERGLRSALTAAARVRGCLEAARGRPDRATDAFEAGRSLARGLGMPFVQARLAMEHGAFVRRRGERRAAASLLEEAGAILRALGAEPFLRRCERELEGCGRRRAPRGASHLSITPQELAVARLVARGLSNRDVAADLVVSVKTVEYHLSNLYAKLGVSTRTQLVARLGQAEDVLRGAVDAPQVAAAPHRRSSPVAG